MIFDGALFLENQPLSGDSLQDLRDEVGVTVCAKELTLAPPTWGREIAVGVVARERVLIGPNVNRLRRDSRSMLPANKEITVDMPPGPYTYREAQELLGARFDPAGNEALASGGTFVLHHADHAVGLDVSPSLSGKRLDAVTVYDGNFADTWRAQLSDVLEVLSSGETAVSRVLFRVQGGGGEGL